MALKWKDLADLGGARLVEATDEADARKKSKADPDALVWWPEETS